MIRNEAIFLKGYTNFSTERSMESIGQAMSKSMPEINPRAKIVIIATMVVSVTFLHYATGVRWHHLHIIYQGLYYLPLILAGFWFGLRGALASSLVVTVLYAPFILIHWERFSQNDFSRIMEIVHYYMVVLIIGLLTDRQRLQQERINQAERLAAIGKAMAGVAHDMKTPLIAIGGFTRLVMTRIQKARPDQDNFAGLVKETEEKLSIVLKEAGRLEKMVHEMLDFSRPLELHRSKEDVDELVKESAALIGSAAEEKKVRVLAIASRSLPQVSLDAMRMKQVLINLLMNAVQASPEGETVTVRSYRNGRKLHIDVIDSGSGIPPDKREEIFTPFFTTKREGTGLGLPVVEKIIEAHQGHLQIVDNPERGITFRVVIPML